MPQASSETRRGAGPVQRAKSSNTRERVVRAAIELIADEGLEHATVMKIAYASGVSWGGIQHQFGGKAGILKAVLEQVMADFQSNVQHFSTRATTTEGRVRALVTASWELMRDPTYQAFREVMRDPTSVRGAPESESMLSQVSDALEPLRAQLFPELAGAPRTLELMNLVTFATLSGMAEQARYSSIKPAMMHAQLKLLIDTVVGIVRERRSY